DVCGEPFHARLVDGATETLTAMNRQTPRDKFVGTSIRCFIVATLLACPGYGAFAVPVAQTEKTTVAQGVRECSAGFSTVEGQGKTNSAHKKKPTEATSLQSCVEIRGSSLVAQEYLQKVIWELHWTVNDKQATEELWSFSMRLSAEDLANCAKPFSD